MASRTFTWEQNVETPENSLGRARKLWLKVRAIKWHQYARGVAALVLLDQWLGPLGGIPPSEAIVVACIGALFAPVPVERRRNGR